MVINIIIDNHNKVQLDVNSLDSFLCSQIMKIIT